MADHLINVRVVARMEAAGLDQVVSSAQAALGRLRAQALTALQTPAGTPERAAAVGGVREELRTVRETAQRQLEAHGPPAPRPGQTAAEAEKEWRTLQTSVGDQLTRIARHYKRLFGEEFGQVETQANVRARMEERRPPAVRDVAQRAGGIREEGEEELTAAQRRTQAAFREAGVLEELLTIERDYITAAALLTEARRSVALAVERELLQSKEYIATLAGLREAQALLSASVREQVNQSSRYIQGRARGQVAGTVERAAVGRVAALDPALAQAQGQILVTDQWGRAKRLDAAASLGLAHATVAAQTAQNQARAATATLGAETEGLVRSEVVLQTANARAASAVDRAAVAATGEAAELRTAQTEQARARRTRRVRVLRTEGEDPGLAGLSAEERLVRLQNLNAQKRQLLENNEYVAELEERKRLARQEREIGRVPRTPPPAPGGGGGGLGELLGGRLITGATFAVSALSFRQIYTSVKQLVSAAEDLELAFTRLETQMEAIGQGDQFDTLRRNILGISRDTGVAGDALAAVAQQALGVYQDVTRASDAVRAVAQLGVVTGQDPAQVFQDLNPAALAFGVTVDALGDKVVGLGQRFGVPAKNLEDFFGRVGTLAAESGLTLEQTGALAGVIQQRLAIGGTQAGELFDRVLSGISEKSSKLLEVYRTSPQLRARLPQLEAAVGTGDEGKVLLELTAAYQKLDPVSRAAILNTIAGKRERAEFTAVLEGGQNALDREATNTSDAGRAAKAFADAQKTLRVELQRFGQDFKQLGSTLARAGLFDALKVLASSIDAIITGLRDFVGIFAWINDHTGGWAGKIAGIAFAYGTLRIAILAVKTALESEALANVVGRLGGGGGLFFGTGGGGAEGGGGGGGGGLVSGGLAASLFRRRGRVPIPEAAPAEAAAGDVPWLTGGTAGATEAAVAGETATGLGLGGIAAGILASPVLPIALIGGGIYKSVVDARIAKDKENAAAFAAALNSGTEADRANVQRIADSRTSIASRTLTLLKDPVSLWHGVEHLLNPRSNAAPIYTEPQKAQEALELDNRKKIAVTTKMQLDAGEAAGVLHLEKHFKDHTAYINFLNDLAAGDPGAADTAANILRDMQYRLTHNLAGSGPAPVDPDPGRYERYVGALAAQGAGAVDTVQKTVQDQTDAVTNAQKQYEAGSISRAAYIKVLADALKVQNDAIAAGKTAGHDPAPDVKAQADAIAKTLADATQQALDDTLAFTVSVANLAKSQTRDPALKQKQDAAIAAANQAAAQAAFDKNKAATGVADPGLEAKLNQAKAASADVAAAGEDIANAISAARIKYARVQIGTSGNILEDARTQKALADEATRVAVGDVAKLDALTAEAQADKSMQDALVKIAESKTNLLIAVANAAGDQVRAASLAEGQVQDELKRALATPGTGEEVINDLRAKAVASQDQLSATRVSQTREIIDFQLDMGEITVGQAIAQLQALLASPDVQSNAGRVRQIRSAIRSLQKQTQADLAFNIGDLKLPTLYEVRRTEAIGQQGYSDNRNVSIDISVYNQGDLDQAVETFTAAVNAPSRYGTAPRVYPSAYN